MASIRKAKKLGIYKAPKYTKDRAKLMADIRKLVDQANRRLKGLNQAGYKGTWASKKLAERLDTKVLKAWAKQGKIKVNKNLTNTQLKAIQKATQQFLISKTSKPSGIRKVKESTLDSLRATLSEDIELDEMDVETAYEMLSNKAGNAGSQDISSSNNLAGGESVYENYGTGGEVRNAIAKNGSKGFLEIIKITQ